MKRKRIPNNNGKIRNDDSFAKLPPEITLQILSFYELVFQSPIYTALTTSQLIRLFYGYFKHDRSTYLVFKNVTLAIKDANLVYRSFGKFNLTKNLPLMILSLDISNSTTDLLKQVINFTHLECLFVQNITVPNNYLTELYEKITRLRVLDLLHSELIQAEKQSLFYKNFSNLRMLRTASINIISLEIAQTILYELHKLKNLDITYHSEGSHDRPYILKFDHHKHLKSLRIRCESSDKRLLKIEPNQVLCILKLSDVNLDDETSDWIFGTNQLHTLSIKNTPCYETDYLEEHVTHPPPPISKHGLRLLPYNTSLTNLSIRVIDNEFYDHFFHMMSSRKASWHKLYIEESIDGKVDTNIFEQDSLCSQLTQLGLSMFDNVGDILSKILPRASQLKSLRLRDCGINDSFIITTFGTLLKEIHIIACDIDQNIIPKLCSSEGLESLTMEGDAITSQDVVAIANSNLKVFITDYELNSNDLNMLLCNSDLNTLIVKDNMTTDEMVKSVMKSKTVSVLGVHYDEGEKWKDLYQKGSPIQRLILH